MPEMIFKRSERGIVIPVVLCFSLIFSLFIAGFTVYASGTAIQIRKEEQQIKTFYVAEAVTEKGLAEVKLFVQNNGRMPINQDLSSAPDLSAAGYTIDDYEIDLSGAWITAAIQSGDYAGLNGSVKNIPIDATVRKAGSATQKAELRQTAEVQFIPVFQFGVFYQNDLEIHPGANMTFTGPVHTNANMYMDTYDGWTTTFDSTITALGNIYHAKKDGEATRTGDVRIEDSDGVDQSMNLGGGTWLDSNHADWVNQSQDKWDGNVRSAAHGTYALNLPLPSGSTSHTMIERRVNGESSEIQGQKMDYKAHLRIVDGTVLNSVGGTVELRYCSGGGTFAAGACPGGQSVVNPISTTTFYDSRQSKMVQSTDLDVNKLNSSPAFQTLVNANNGVIVYSSDRRNLGSSTKLDALRLVNASTLPTKGVTFASENPVYVKGHYNINTKKPSGIVTDAFTILSSSWNDANAATSSSSLSNRVAGNTTVNTAVIAGNTNTSVGSYNGGFENIHRLLENWNNKTLTYSGSVVILYNSQLATAQWQNTGVYYRAPIRSWGFDSNFADPNYMIPGFPSVYTILKSKWEQF